MICAWCRHDRPAFIVTPKGADICVDCVLDGMKRAADARARSTPAPRKGGLALPPADPWPFTGHRSMADIDREREAAE